MTTTNNLTVGMKAVMLSWNNWSDLLHASTYISKLGYEVR